MRTSFWLLAAGLSLAGTSAVLAEPPEPHFRAVTIDDRVQIGYGVAVADIDGDGKPDIVLADKKQIVWYKNPGGDLAAAPHWQKFVIAENLTLRDDVCLAIRGADDDGKCALAVGADWDPGDTENSGAVFYLVAPADPTQRWEPIKLHAEPVVHRMRWIRLPNGKWGLVVVPLHGRGNKNGEGAGVRVLLYHPPEGDPHRAWTTETLDDSMHMTHNFTPDESGRGLLVAGREGLVDLEPAEHGWKRTPLPFIQETAGPDFKGLGEIRLGHAPDLFLATVEPMHGNSLVAYSRDGERWRRRVLTDQLVEGHALACADFLGTGSDQIAVGWRGNPHHPKPVGIHIWTPLDLAKDQWRESAVDDDGIACEDLQAADVDGDGKIDLVGAGRASHNLKLYLNAR